jgi:hypothetical protein
VQNCGQKTYKRPQKEPSSNAMANIEINLEVFVEMLDQNICESQYRERDCWLDLT